jgi:putative ABC transport system permease protein
MFFLRLALTAVRSLETHFLRSLLATVGVLIGVGSVVACMSILEGASRNLMKSFRSLGSNVLYVMPAVARVEGRPVGSAQTLKLSNIDTLLRELPQYISTVAPEALGTATIRRLQKSQEYTVVATSEVYFATHAYQVISGRVFSRQESGDELATVACLGHKVSETLFGGSDPVGQSVKIGGAAYRVIGVMEKKGNLGFLNADETVYIPIKAGLKRFFNRDYLNRLTIEIKDPSRLEEAQKKIKQTLRAAHNIRVGEPEDFSIFNQQEVLKNVNQIMFIWKAVFYSIAGISLVVGGIGIMNIMLVSVTERTREIGVRMAVGARRSDILLQFLVEALIISSLGGGFGLLFGAMCSDLMNQVLRDFEFKTEVTAAVIITALVTTTTVGVLSGLYPAYKASRLDPVEALRYE